MDASKLKWMKRGTCSVVAALMSFFTWELHGQEMRPISQSSMEKLTKPAAVQIEMSDGNWLRHELDKQPAGGMKAEDAQPRTLAKNSQPFWDIIMFEGFETSFPANQWAISFKNVAPYFWNDVSHNPRTGALSGWCAGGTVSPNPVLNPATGNYVNNMNSVMVFGPFSLSGATNAKLDFWYWLDSQVDYDFLIWAASTSPSGPFHGFQTSGNSEGYQFQSFDLKNVPTLGNLLGRPQVYIAFFFQSDFTETQRGAFLDDIFLLKQPSTTVIKADLVPYEVYLRTGPNGTGTVVSNPVLGQSYYPHFNWRNEGPVAANNFRWEVRLNGAVVCSNNNQSASPNTSFTSSCQTALIWNCPSGANNLEAVMDVTEVIDETGETNNTASKSFPCPLPDLVGKRIYLRTGPNSGSEVDSPVAGQSYYLHFDWSNTGSSVPDARIDLKFNNTVICSYNSGFIPASHTSTSWCTTPVIWPAPPTVVFIEGALDVNKVVTEQDENNNVISRSFVSAQPNLTTTAFSFSPISANAGGSVTLSGTIINNGAFATPTGIKVNFYLSANSNAPNLNLLLLSTTIAALGAGQSNNFALLGTVPLNIASGSYYVWISIDPDKTIGESNENDNLLFSTTLLTVTTTPAAGEIKPVAGATQSIGTPFTVEVTVTNVQNLFGVGFELNYNTTYLDVVGTPTAGAFMGSDPIFLPTVNDPAGKVSIGVSHKAGQPSSTGSGVVARVTFNSLASTPPGTPAVFSISAVSANDAAGSVIALTPSNLAITLGSTCAVWPGDTNNDGVVNQADVLPIGLHWSRTGPPRQGASLSWTAQPCPVWTPVTAANADANGDGVINQADVLPVGLNWGRTHTSMMAEPLGKAHSSFSALLEPEIDSVPMPGEQFSIRMKLSKATDLFGLAFELSYDRPGELQILAVEPDEGFSPEALFYSKVDEATGRIAVGISRKAGQEGRLMAGSVVRIKAKLAANARLGETMTFSLQDEVANDAAGRLIEVHSQVLRMKIGLAADAEAENKSQLIGDYRLHQNVPNPFSANGTLGNPGTTI
ncbi:MAG: cohesin domain-containing protein, partial [bacterium]